MSVLLTAIIPTFKRPASLSRAIESVLGQTLADLELHVYDNASGDETASVVARYAAKDPRVHYHCHPVNIGAVQNFRYGMQRVESPFFHFLADDDILLPEFYHTAISTLKRHPKALFAAFPVIEIDDSGSVMVFNRLSPGRYAPPDGFLTMASHEHPIWTGIVWRFDVIARAGSLADASAVMIDLDYLLRVAALGEFVVPPVPGAVFVHHEGGASAGAKLDATYNGWRSTLATVRQMDSLPPEVRQAAIQALERRLAALLFGLGIGASRRGRFAEAREAAGLLNSEFRRKWRAVGIELVAQICELIPSSRRALSWLVMARRPYRRHGWTGRPYSVLEELDRLGLTVPPVLESRLRHVAFGLDVTRAKGFDSPTP